MAPKKVKKHTVQAPDGVTEYFVEKILGVEMDANDDELIFQVKWQYFDDNHISWQPTRDLHGNNKFIAYCNKMRKRAAEGNRDYITYVQRLDEDLASLAEPPLQPPTPDVQVEVPPPVHEESVHAERDRADSEDDERLSSNRETGTSEIGKLYRQLGELEKRQDEQTVLIAELQKELRDLKKRVHDKETSPPRTSSRHPRLPPRAVAKPEPEMPAVAQRSRRTRAAK